MGICGIYVRTSVETDGTSIEQQKELGIKFCESQGFQYQIYEDIGKSGYKIDDDNDPFKNRPGIAKLIDDIENNAVDKVWVWEYSRLSRNELASYVLRKIFVKNKTVIYENGKQFNMDDPLSIMIDGILTHVSRYERNKITGRTTRGIRDRINTGRRSYVKVYGYRQVGKVDRFMAWEPVRSEIANIKYAFEEFLKGKPINGIVKDLHDDMTETELKTAHKKYRNILLRFDYTGFSLTTEGSEMYSKYKSFEIENIDFLNGLENGKPKYYLPSVNYSVQNVSVEDWIAVSKKLRENKRLYKNRKRATSTTIFTGIINCPYCGLHYYFYNKDGYRYYTHIPTKKCLQRPKSVRREKVNSLAEVFYFYFYLVYDDTRELLEENQTITNLNLAKIKDKISAAQSENRGIEKQVKRFQTIYEQTDDMELLKLTLAKENELKLKLEAANQVITKLKSELARLKNEYDRDKMELTYYSVKEKVIDFFEKLSVENKRAELIRIIKTCQLFSNYFLINAGKLLFVFSIKQDYKLPEKVYEAFKNDIDFKSNFLNSNTLWNEDGTYQKHIQKLLNIPKEEANQYTLKQLNEIKDKLLEIENKVIDWLIVRRVGEFKIREYHLVKPENKMAMEKRLEKSGIDYRLKDIIKVVSFADDI